MNLNLKDTFLKPLQPLTERKTYMAALLLMTVNALITILVSLPASLIGAILPFELYMFGWINSILASLIWIVLVSKFSEKQAKKTKKNAKKL